MRWKVSRKSPAKDVRTFQHCVDTAFIHDLGRCSQRPWPSKGFSLVHQEGPLSCPPDMSLRRAANIADRIVSTVIVEWGGLVMLHAEKSLWSWNEITFFRMEPHSEGSHQNMATRRPAAYFICSIILSLQEHIGQLRMQRRHGWFQLREERERKKISIQA